MKTYYFLGLCLLLLGCVGTEDKKDDLALGSVDNTSKKRILFVVSNAHFYGTSDIEATNHFPEIILAHQVFVNAGFEVDFVSPQGGTIPIGYIYSSDEITQSYLYDCSFMKLLQTTKAPKDIRVEEYIAVYYPGGGSAMFTVPENTAIQNITTHVYEKNKGVVAAVCHGTAGLMNIKLNTGEYLIRDKKISGFPDMFEDVEATYYQEFPFSIQNVTVERGGDFKFSKKGWDGYYVVDGRVVTGQDPTSSALVAKNTIEVINSKTKIQL